MELINKIKLKIQRKEKKDVRRRSNWYIYLISFTATFALLGLFVLAFQGTLFPQTPTGMTDWRGMGTFTPEAELDTTVLFMASNEQGSIPNKYMLLNYRPRDGAIVIVPLSENTRTGSGRLTDLYRQGGARAVMSGIESTLGVECEFYVLFDRSSFTGFISPLGEVLMRIPYDFTGGGINISAGEHRLSGGDLFTYMNLFNPADFPQAGSDYNLVIMGTAITTLLNLNCRNMDSETIQDAFNKILNNATTNLTFRDFTAYQRALLYTSENSFNPASYYLPTGHHELGEFIISNQSIANILDRFNLRAEHMGD